MSYKGASLAPLAESVAESAFSRKHSKSPRTVASLGHIDRPKAIRYSSPQMNRPFTRVNRASSQKKGQKMDLKGNGRAKRSQSKRMQQQLDQENVDG